MQGRVLLIHEEPRIAALLRRTLHGERLAVETEADPETALRRLRTVPFDVVVVSLHVAGVDGLDVLRRARTVRPECEVVVVARRSSIDLARSALKQGAVDYLLEPFCIERELLPILREVLGPHELAEATERRGAERPADVAPNVSLPIGNSAALRDAVERARKVARSESPVLLLGESGSGKELFANLVHALSARRDRPFLRVSCAALPESLLENELFGHVRGAFTGAHRDQPGLFACADGGTLLLDEIGELAPAVQPKLLRVLQQGEFQRIGEPGRTTRVDVRIVAATHRDLRAAVGSGSFREDLFYRLAVVPIEIPPLRERPEDLPALLEHFTARLGSRARFSEAAFDAMRRYPWPGNVRELANAVEHAVVLSDAPDGLLQPDDLPAAIQDHARSRRPQSEAGGTLESIERRTILNALARTAFNRTEAARLLGVTRRTLGYRIQKYELAEQIEAMRALQQGNRLARAALPRAKTGTE